MPRSILVTILVLILGANARADEAIDSWTAELLAGIRADGTAPPVAVRSMAMMYVAMFDAANVASGSPFETYAGPVPIGPDADPRAAVASAAHRVLSALFPARSAALDARLAAALSVLSAGPAKTHGVALGEARAQAILAARAADGANAVVTHVSPSGPGFWKPTPPAFAPALLPQWPGVLPWAIESGDQFRPAGPAALDSAEWIAAFAETKALGAMTGSTRSAEQTEIALFWADGRYTFTPPGHWLQIATQVATGRALTLLDEARLLALLSMAMADAAIVAWDAKFAFSNWRPVTAIAAEGAASDGISATVEDPSWLPLIATPPFPDYISGHSTFSGAAATVLARYFGSDSIPFSTVADPSSDVADVVRAFDGFWDAAEEAGRSRIYAGIHWEFSNQDGLAAGRSVGNLVYDEFLEPIPEPLGATLLAPGVAALFVRRWAERSSCPRAARRVQGDLPAIR